MADVHMTNGPQPSEPSEAGSSTTHGYDPRGVEERWYRFWEERNLFHADETSTASPYSWRNILMCSGKHEFCAANQANVICMMRSLLGLVAGR